MFKSLAFITAALTATSVPAFADSVGITAGEAIPFQSAARSIGGTSQLNLGFDVSLNRVPVIPIRPALMFDYAGGSANGGSLNDYGAGLGARLTTPFYAGAAAFIYNVNAKFGAGNVSNSTTGAGAQIFVGEKIVPLPGGAGIGAQITYRTLPVVNGVNPSGLSFALRGSF